MHTSFSDTHAKNNEQKLVTHYEDKDGAVEAEKDVMAGEEVGVPILIGPDPIPCTIKEKLFFKRAESESPPSVRMHV
jgi:hypothetical protein